MAGKWYEIVTGSLEHKRQYREYKRRIEALPEPYRGAAKAVERYLLSSGAVLDGDTMVIMLGDLADLWERAAVEGTPVREVVGDEPSDFVEEFARAYAGRQWLDKERARLNKSIDDAERGREL